MTQDIRDYITKLNRTSFINTLTATAILRKLAKNAKFIVLMNEHEITCRLAPWKGTQSTSYLVAINLNVLILG